MPTLDQEEEEEEKEEKSWRGGLFQGINLKIPPGARRQEKRGQHCRTSLKVV